MKKWRKLIGEIELTKDLSLLLVIGGLYSLSIALSNTFVNIFLWKQSGAYLDIALYNLAIVVMQPLTFILAGRWAKKIDRVIVLRIGVIFLSLFYLAVLFAGSRAADFLLLLGGLLGVGYGFYWLAYNVLTFEVTEPETRDFFNGFLGILSSGGGMIGPLAAGLIISKMESNTGYSVIFGVSLFLFSVAVFFSFYLKRRPAEGRYEFLRIWKERRNNRNWRLVTDAHLLQGLREGVFAFIISVFVFISTGSEMALGTFALVNSSASFIAYYLVSRLIKKEQRKKAILFGGILLFVSILLILFKLTYPMLLIYGVVIAVAYPLMLVPYMSITYDVIGQAWKAAEMRIEYIVVKEVFLNIGRILSILLFIGGIQWFKDEQAIPVLLLLLGSGHAFIYFFIKKVKFASSRI